MSQPHRAFRDALGAFTTGVCIVTVPGKGAEPSGAGLTINSFASVSLAPPLVLWSLDKASDRFDLFERASHFGINVLSDTDQALSQHFSRKGHHRLEGAGWTHGPHDIPLRQGALAWFACEKHARHEGGDHLILVGRVVSFGGQKGEAPLVYFRGQYATLQD